MVKNTKEHILNVTFKLFLQKSFKQVTLKEIVEETGLSKGAFYHYFTSKEQIFLQLVNNQINAWKEIIHVARKNGEIKSPMSDEQIAGIFINSSGGLEMNSVFEGNSKNIDKTLLSLWNSFYEGLKA